MTNALLSGAAWLEDVPRRIMYTVAAVLLVVSALGASLAADQDRAEAGQWRWTWTRGTHYVFDRWETAELAKWEPGHESPWLRELAATNPVGWAATGLNLAFFTKVKLTAMLAQRQGNCVSVTTLGFVAPSRCG